eukprot:CAMPEP_0194228326 /NCGR_PEP_ID=MMETSP0156-20130528/43316_1 /TAXON_ID=33649 /ORGANISM="Thalassionema nitzschioides, Strain L26-B" /LENGTH=35 /DNA_ID= /DNA_START= /DNA_END= /DNA_ORIENTATION=
MDNKSDGFADVVVVGGVVGFGEGALDDGLSMGDSV